MTTRGAAGASALPHAPRKRVVLWGTFDTHNTRNRMTAQSLMQAATVVATIHRPLWTSHRDKTLLRRMHLVAVCLKIVPFYILLIADYLRAPAHDAVIVCHPGCVDALVIRPFATLRGARVIFDLFFSLYDTIVNDRKLLSSAHPCARLLFHMERRAANKADIVITDTGQHAAHLASVLRLACMPQVIPVGMDERAFPPAALPAHHSPFIVLFCAKFSPLHGLRHVLAALPLLAGHDLRLRLIGTGQESSLIERYLAQNPDAPVTWLPECPYATLHMEIAQAHLCLGVFGESTKAHSVIPHKLYQALAVGRPVVTLDTAALRACVPQDIPGLYRVLTPEPHAIAQAILTCMSQYEALRAAVPLFAPLRLRASDERLALCWRKLLA